MRRLGQALQAAGRGLGSAAGELSGQVKSLIPAGWSGSPADLFGSDWAAKAGQAGQLAAICTHAGGVLVDLANAIDAANKQASKANAQTAGGGRAAALNGPDPAKLQAQRQMMSQATSGAQQARAAARGKLAGIAVPRIGKPLTSAQVSAWAVHLAPAPKPASHGGGGVFGAIGGFFSNTVAGGASHLLDGAGHLLDDAGHVAGNVLDGTGHFAEGFLWDGAVGVLRGLGDLVGMGPLWGDPSFLKTWYGLYEVAAPIANPGLLLTNPEMAQADLAFGKSLLAWDEWKKDPARAAGNVVFNIATLPFVASKVLDIGTAGKVAADAGEAGADTSKAGSLSADASKAGSASNDSAKAGNAVRFPDLKPMDPRFSYENIPEKSPWGSTVKYLDATERQQLKLTVRNGLLYDAKGDLFDTRNAGTHWSGQGRAIFVMDENGDLYASKFQERGAFHHSSILAGDPVAGAGELKVTDGKLEIISDNSGHYSPPRPYTMQVVNYLRSLGVHIADNQIEYHAPPP